jgi:hypothetical protein
MMGRMRDAYPEIERLDMATVDVRTAYNQYLLQVGKAVLLTTEMESPTHPGEPVVAISIVGVFGDAGAGDGFTSTITEAQMRILNAAQSVAHLRRHPDGSLLKRCEGYIDDDIIVAPGIQAAPDSIDQSRFVTAGGITATRLTVPTAATLEIHRAVIDARTEIANLLGEQAMKEDKIQLWLGGGVAIGWDFDLRYNRFSVTPKPAAMDKLVKYLFLELPTDLGPLDGHVLDKDPLTNKYIRPSIPCKTIETLRGLLCRYATVIPLATCHVYSFFQMGIENKDRVKLSPMAARDIAYWRTIILLVIQYPHLFGARINNLRLDRITSCYMNTDASTSIGGGGTLTMTPNWIPGRSSIFFVVRWWHDAERASLDKLHAVLLSDLDISTTDKEKALKNVSGFQVMVTSDDNHRLMIHINIREFTSTNCGIWIHITLLADKVTDIGGDNVACLCWLIKHKATNFMADRLLKITSLLCFRFRVQIIDHKIKGSLLYQPDWLSRAEGLNYLDPPEDYGPLQDETHFFQTIEGGCGNDYRKLCRIVLQRCMITHSYISFRELYRTVSIMAKYAQQYRPPNEPTVIRILDAIQYKHGSAPTNQNI